MFFRQYDLACLSLYSYLIGDTTTGRAVVVDPQRDISEYLADAEATRPDDRAGDRDPLPRRLPLRPPRARRRHRRGRSPTATRRSPTSRSTRSPTARRSRSARSPSRSATPPGTRPSRSRSSCPRSTPTPSRGRCSPATPCSSATSAGPTCSPPSGRSADEPRPRPATTRCRRSCSRCPTPRCVYPAHGAGSACGKHMSAAASSTIGEQRATNYALAPMTEDAVRRGGHRGPDRWRRCTSRSPPTPTAASAICSTINEPPAVAHHRRRARRSATTCAVLHRHPLARVVRVRPPARLDQRRPRRPLRRVRRRRRPARASESSSSATPARDRGQGPPGPDRLRRRRRRGRRHRTRARRPPRPRRRRAAGSRPATSRAGLSEDDDRAGRRRPQPGETAVGGTIPGARTDAAPAAARPPRRARPHPTHHRLLRRRLPLVDRRIDSARPRLHRRCRHHRRLRRLDSGSP